MESWSLGAIGCGNHCGGRLAVVDGGLTILAPMMFEMRCVVDECEKILLSQT